MSPRSRPRGVLNIALVSTAALAFMAGTAGCALESPPKPQAASEEQKIVSCGYQDGEDWVVLPEDHCDDDGDGHGGGGFIGIFSSSSHHHPNAYTSPGSRLPRAPMQGTPIRYNDAGARTTAGLPGTGKVATGSRTVGSSGIGKGATGGQSGGGG